VTVWDWALIFCVAVMGTFVAYLKNPEHKAFMIMLPFPFTMAVMAVGHPVDASNVIGLCSMFGYTFLVWYFRMRWRLPIILAIVLAVLLFSIAGVTIAQLQPTGNGVFWWSLAGSLLLACVCIWRMPYRVEPHYRTPLPIWIKFPAIVLVVAGVCAIKKYIGGFTTVFPMVGLVASYESRNSLWTNVRRIPWVIITMAPFFVVIRVLQGRFGELNAMLMAWPVFVFSLWIWHTQYSKRPFGKYDAEDVDSPVAERTATVTQR
jgi:hypothetical protein